VSTSEPIARRRVGGGLDQVSAAGWSRPEQGGTLRDPGQTARMASHLNVEIKARCADPDAVLRRLAELGAEEQGVDRQVDTYFPAAAGRLKLREGGIENYLIHYVRPDERGPKNSQVTLHELDPDDAPAIRDVLAVALGVAVAVSKSRRILWIDNVKFHVDEVEDLGSFVEIEAMDRTGARGRDLLLEQCERYVRLLAIDPADLEPRSYSDLLLALPTTRLASVGRSSGMPPHGNWRGLVLPSRRSRRGGDDAAQRVEAFQGVYAFVVEGRERRVVVWVQRRGFGPHLALGRAPVRSFADVDVSEPRVRQPLAQVDLAQALRHPLVVAVGWFPARQDDAPPRDEDSEELSVDLVLAVGELDGVHAQHGVHRPAGQSCRGEISDAEVSRSAETPRLLVGLPDRFLREVDADEHWFREYMTGAVSQRG
jgi:adenylate cyclase class 2